ncbi:radical SAM protein [Thomasclavelia sp.]
MTLSTFGLLYTKKCTAACEMCCFSCSPEETEKIEFDDAVRYIKEISEFKQFKSVGLTGGECMMYYEEILELIRLAHSKKLKVSLSTNGFWARTLNETNKIIDELIDAGLTTMTVSIDEYHQKYIPVENVKNILIASRLKNIGIYLGSLCSKSHHGIEKLLPSLENHVLNAAIIQAPVQPVGRAKMMIDDSEYIYADNIHFKKCIDMNDLCVFPNGDCFPCCSQSGMTPALYLGNTKEMTIKEILQNYNANIYCKILKRYGLEWFEKINRENNLNIKLKNRYVNACDLCNDFLHDSENLKKFDPFIELEKEKFVREILEKKSLLEKKRIKD